jgi:hypothetical protein
MPNRRLVYTEGFENRIGYRVVATIKKRAVIEAITAAGSTWKYMPL